MNDFGNSDHNLDLSFKNTGVIDTVSAYGFRKPNGGGGVGACDIIVSTSNYSPLKPDLVGTGNVLFEAYTANPKSTTSFKVPLTGKRMDVGKLPAIRVNIYAN